MKLIELLVGECAGVGRIVPGVNTTVDVGPGEIRRQAAKWGFDVSADGVPPLISSATSSRSRKTKGKRRTRKAVREGNIQLRPDDLGGAAWITHDGGLVDVHWHEEIAGTCFPDEFDPSDLDLEAEDHDGEWVRQRLDQLIEDSGWIRIVVTRDSLAAEIFKYPDRLALRTLTDLARKGDYSHFHLDDHRTGVQASFQDGRSFLKAILKT